MAAFELLHATAQVAAAGECGGLLPLLCDPDVHLQAAGAYMAAQACAGSAAEAGAGAPAAGAASASADVMKRLLELLSSGVGAAQQHAAQALAHAMRDPAAEQQIVGAVNESAGAKELLAVLADSSDVELAAQAERLLESAEAGAGKKKGKRRKELKRGGLEVLFGRQKQLGWREPEPDAEYGESLCGHHDDVSTGEWVGGKRIFVEGYGQGEVLEFNPSKLSASSHSVRFDDDSENDNINAYGQTYKEVKLRRKATARRAGC